MSSVASLRSLFVPSEDDDEARLRNRDRACIAAGVVAGVGFGALAGAFARPGAVFLIVLGALLGGVFGRSVASHISADDWDPPPSRRPYVGANSPDDDGAVGG